MQIEFFKAKEWRETEEKLARKFGLKIYPANDRIVELLIEEITLADFSLQDILKVFQEEYDDLIDFSERWHADCNHHDYGEEWDFEEGDQQSDTSPKNVVGISQGFMVSYILFFLYARFKPDLLFDFLRRRRIPYAKKVVNDIKRIYLKTTEKNA